MVAEFGEMTPEDQAAMQIFLAQQASQNPLRCKWRWELI